MLLPLITRTYEYLGLTRLTTLLELGDVMWTVFTVAIYMQLFKFWVFSFHWYWVSINMYLYNERPAAQGTTQDPYTRWRGTTQDAIHAVKNNVQTAIAGRAKTCEDFARLRRGRMSLNTALFDVNYEHKKRNSCDFGMLH